MRLFVAINLSDDLRSDITGVMHELKKAGVKGSYVPMQNLHLTLAFIGETDSASTVKAALAGISVKPFRLTLTGMGSFGDTLWIGVKGNQGLSQLAKSVRDALDAAGIPYDRKSFSPHITVVRKAAGKWQQAAVPRSDMMVKGFSLMKSEQRSGKQVYTEVR